MSLGVSPDTVTASSLTRSLASVIGHTHTGYKGNETLIHGQCCVWIAEYGEVSYRGVTAVTPDGIILTALMSGNREPVSVPCPQCGGAGNIKA